MRKEIDKEVIRAKGGTAKAAKKIVEEGGDIEVKKIDRRQKQNWSKSVARLPKQDNHWKDVDPQEAIQKVVVGGFGEKRGKSSTFSNALGVINGALLTGRASTRTGLMP